MTEQEKDKSDSPKHEQKPAIGVSVKLSQGNQKKSQIIRQAKQILEAKKKE